MSLFDTNISITELKALITAGADVNVIDDCGNGTPLHGQKDPESIKALIDAGADVDARDYHGCTAFHNYSRSYGCTIRTTNPIIVKTFIFAGADVKIRDNCGRIPFDNPLIKQIYYEIKASLKIYRFMKNFRFWKLYKYSKSREFIEWYYHPDNRGGKLAKIEIEKLVSIKENFL